MNKTSKKRKLYGFLILVHMFAGMIVGIYGFVHMQDCLNSLLFFIVFGVIGIVISELIFIRLKTRFIKMKILDSGLWTLRIYIGIGFIGISLTLGAIFNKTTSKLKSCDNYTVIEKQYRERGFRTGEAFFLYVNVDGQTKKLNCKKRIWETLFVGQLIEVCIYHSLIGLDYVEMTNDK